MKINRTLNVPRIKHLVVWAADIGRTAAFLDEALG